MDSSNSLSFSDLQFESSFHACTSPDKNTIKNVPPAMQIPAAMKKTFLYCADDG